MLLLIKELIFKKVMQYERQRSIVHEEQINRKRGYTVRLLEY